MLNNALRLIRVYHNLSQTETATKLGMSKSYLSEIENGQKKATIKTLEKYCRAFNLPMSSIMFFAEKSDGVGYSAGMAQSNIARKALKMLDWIATIAEENDERGSVKSCSKDTQ